jgi:hypothetical protein
MGDGFPRPVDQIRALGNSIVSVIPEMIGRAIMTGQSTSTTEGSPTR